MLLYTDLLQEGFIQADAAELYVPSNIALCNSPKRFCWSHTDTPPITQK